MAKVVKIDPFNSETGAGTLSGYAKQYGVSVDQIMQANVGNSAVKDPNLITAGGHLIIPDARSVQQTDTQYRATTNERSTALTEKIAGMSGGTQGQAEDAANPDASHPPMTDEKGNTIAVWNRNLNGYRDTMTGGRYKPPQEKVAGDGGVKDEISKIKEEGQSQIDAITSKLDKISVTQNQATANLIDSVKQIYGARIAKMEDSNKRLLATKEKIGIRQGRSRYAPTLQAGILTDEEISGHQRISELEGKMMEIIAKAQIAQGENDMANFNAEMDELDRIEKNMQTEIMDMHKRAVDEENKLIARERENRLADKEDFDKMLDLSERSAPAVYGSLAKFTSEADKQAFLEEYSKKTGIDLDVLTGDIEDYAFKSKKEKLDLQNVQSQIDRRTKLNADEEEEDEYQSGSTKNVIAGVTALDDLSGADKEKVKTDLRELGFYDDNPPGWYVEMKKAENPNMTVHPDFIKRDWKAYREGIIGV